MVTSLEDLTTVNREFTCRLVPLHMQSLMTCRWVPSDISELKSSFVRTLVVVLFKP